MYLLDTNVVSEMRKPRTVKQPRSGMDSNVAAWAENTLSTSMYISTITLMEIELGTLLMERKDVAQGAVLRKWMNDGLMPAFGNRVLKIDSQIALRCAMLHVSNPKSYRDSLIGATAIVHGMTVVTRNVSDFKPTGAAILNPWGHPPSVR